MTDRPIIFSGAMVSAMLAGRKTQTRRLASSPLRNAMAGDRLYVRESFRLSPDACEGWPPEARPCRGWLDYAAGGHLEVDAPDFQAVLKVAGKDVDWDCLSHAWRPSIHMPRWASRITLIVEAVRVEPLVMISEADAIAEGAELALTAAMLGGPLVHTGTPNVYATPFAWYRDLWNSLHDEPGTRFADNPDVVALTFRVDPQNIDLLEPMEGASS